MTGEKAFHRGNIQCKGLGQEPAWLGRLHGGRCDRDRVREGERGRRWGSSGEQGVTGLPGHSEDWFFSPSEMGNCCGFKAQK